MGRAAEPAAAVENAEADSGREMTEADSGVRLIGSTSSGKQPPMLVRIVKGEKPAAGASAD